MENQQQLLTCLPHTCKLFPEPKWEIGVGKEGAWCWKSGRFVFGKMGDWC